MTPAILFYVLNARLLLSLQVLHVVDFDQLKIENQQCLERNDTCHPFLRSQRPFAVVSAGAALGGL
jgi:hypothetical protein